MTITDDVVRFIADATPPEAARIAAGERLATLRAALRRDGVATAAAHPAGRPTAMNAAWRMVLAASADVSAAEADPGWPVIGAAVIALQGNSVLDGADAVDAVAIGTAVATRVVAALDSSASADRWSRVGVAGVLGAGAAAGRHLRLNDDALRNLLGLCATQAAGLRTLDGSRTGTVQAAKAAADAVEAAVLARSGFTSSVDGLGGRRGLLALMAPGADWAEGGGPAWATTNGH